MDAVDADLEDGLLARFADALLEDANLTRVSAARAVMRGARLGKADLTGADLTPEWGLHLVDANIAMGDLVAIARKQARGYCSPRCPSAR